MEKVVENAWDDLMDAYLQNGALTDEQLKKGIRAATVANKIYPVLCGSSLQNMGVQLVLDAVVKYLPSPLDVPAIKGKNPHNETEEERKPSNTEPMSALAFKIAAEIGRASCRERG